MIDAYTIGVNLILGGDLAEGIDALIPGLEDLDAGVSSATTQGKELAATLRGIGASAPGIGRAADQMARLSEAMAAMNSATEAWRASGGMPQFNVPPAPPQWQTGRSQSAQSGAWQSGARTPMEAAIPALNDNSMPYTPNFTMLSNGALVPYTGPAKAWEPTGMVPYYRPNFTMPGDAERDASFFGEGERVPGMRLNPNGRRSSASPKPHGGSPHDALMLVLGGGIAGEALKHILGPAIDLERTTDVLSADTRLSPADVTGAVARARQTTQLVPGSVSGDNMASLLDLKTVFGSLDEAEKLLPEFAQMTKTFQLLNKKQGGGGDQAFAAAKAMEILGEMVTEKVGPNGETVREMDPERGMKYLSLMQRAAIATDMRVSPKDYLALAKTARVAGLTLSDEFIYEKLPALIQTEGASRTGTALMSMAQVFDGNKLTIKSMNALIGLGLASENGVETHVGGHRNARGEMMGGRSVVHSDAVFDLDVLRHDPLNWVNAAQKRMEAKGIHGTEAQIDALMSASQRTTIAGVLAVLLKDTPAIVKEQTNIRNTDPNAAKLVDDSTAAAVLRVQAAMHNMLTELGSAVLGDAVHTLDGITAALNAIGKWAGDHPDGTKAALEGLSFGILALGAEKVIGALGALGGGGKGGLFMLAGGILALSGAMDKFPEWLQNMTKGAVAGGSVAGVPGAIAGAIGGGAWNLNPLGLNNVTPGQALHGLGQSLTAPYRDPTAPAFNALPQLQSYHPQGDTPGPTIQHITYIHLDDREIARAVTKQQLRMMGGNVSGTLRPDPSIAPQYGAHLVET